MKFIFLSVSENGENGLGDEWADGGNARPPNFWARTASEFMYFALLLMCLTY